MINTDIFFVEDDEDFSIIMKMAVRAINKELKINIVGDGITALKDLQLMAQNKLRPKIILLDLNLPGLSGIEILRKIKDIPFMKTVTVIIFSTSKNQKDVELARQFGADAYIRKPLGYKELITCLEDMIDTWLVVA